VKRAASIAPPLKGVSRDHAENGRASTRKVGEELKSWTEVKKETPSEIFVQKKGEKEHNHGEKRM